MKTRFVLVVAASLLSLHAGAFYQATPEEVRSKSIFDQWYSESQLELTVEVNMQEMMANKMTDNYVPASLTFGKDKSQSITLDAKIRSRGRFRRMNCDFPPLKIKIDKDQLRGNGLKDHNDYKLVTHCADNPTAAEYLLREYLSYELYQELSPISFRAQLVKVTYQDTTTGSVETHMGILLEDTDELAERLGLKTCEECYGLEDSQIQPNNFQIHAMFQYLIGNTDWSISMLRNLKILQNPTTGEYLVAPYDFDFSGLVNPVYAKPLAQYGQTTVRDRVLLASYNKTDWADTKDFMFDRRKALVKKVKEFEGLEAKSKRDILQYISTFYDQLAMNELVFLDK